MKTKIIVALFSLYGIVAGEDSVSAKENYYLKKYPLDYKNSTDQALKRAVIREHNKGYCANKGCSFGETIPSTQKRDNANYLVKRDISGLDIFYVDINEETRKKPINDGKY